MYRDPDDLVFEPARVAETEDVEKLCRAAFAPYVARLGRQIPDGAYDWLEQAAAEGRIWVARRNGDTLGAVAHSETGDAWKLEDVVVSPAAQRGGVGSWMLEQTEAQAREIGVAKLSLDTAKMMPHLIDWYRRHGFEIVAEGLPQHGRDRHPRVFLEKVLI